MSLSVKMVFTTVFLVVIFGVLSILFLDINSPITYLVGLGILLLIVVIGVGFALVIMAIENLKKGG